MRFVVPLSSASLGVMPRGEELVRIGELSRRLGVGTDRLRAWERRYGLLQPVRTAGGFRLYSREDEQRVREMQSQLARGLAAAQAAAVVLANAERAPAAPVEELRAQLAATLARFDATGANAVLDRAFSVHGRDTALREIVYPYLHELGEAWARAEIDVGQEHFASNLLESRLLALSSGWDRGHGPRAVLACAPGERHTLGLAGLGVCLRDRSWSITYLGADTPVAMTTRAAGSRQPQLVVISSTMPNGLPRWEDQLHALAGSVPVALAGPGATDRLAERIGAQLLVDDPVTAAERLAVQNTSQ
jgi:MerR family transcriptional regulator, light-induced transcriptional regulator